MDQHKVVVVCVNTLQILYTETLPQVMLKDVWNTDGILTDIASFAQLNYMKTY